MEIKLTGNVVVRHEKVPDCEWCDKSKQLLDENNIPYTTIISDKKFFGELFRVTNSGKLPQIFMGGKYIGQYYELEKYISEQT